MNIIIYAKLTSVQVFKYIPINLVGSPLESLVGPNAKKLFANHVINPSDKK